LRRAPGPLSSDPCGGAAYEWRPAIRDTSHSPGRRRINRLLGLAFALCLCGALFFAGRTAYLAWYWSDPAHVSQALEPWMTPRYVARSYKLDPRRLAAALGITPHGGERPTLDALARRAGLSFEDYAAKVRQAIAQIRAEPNG
jgi:hypothetical protein